ncbi:MAG: glycosyltransferase [Candidatus Coproplasma sp.]
MNTNAQQKILLLSCGTGEGHNSAAHAIESNLKSMGIFCETRDVGEFIGKENAERVNGRYAGIIRRAPRLFGLVFAAGEAYDRLRLPSPIYHKYAKCADPLYKYIKERGFTRVICTHIFAMNAMTALRNKYGEGIPCYGVMTDYTVHPFVKESELDAYFVPDGRVAGQFMKLGFPAEKIIISGIPVHPKFNLTIDKAQARGALGLDEDKKLVLILTGSEGCGKVKKLCKKLGNTLDDNCNVLVLCGRNEKLKEELDESFSRLPNFKAVGFTKEINLYLRSADCVLSKSGGLSLTEIAVANVPLINLNAVPGLESANLKTFTRHGLSLNGKRINNAVKYIRQLLSDNALVANMLTLQRRYVEADATDIISRTVLEEKTNDYADLDTVYNNRLSWGEYNVLQDNTCTVNT